MFEERPPSSRVRQPAWPQAGSSERGDTELFDPHSGAALVPLEEILRYEMASMRSWMSREFSNFEGLLRLELSNLPKPTGGVSAATLRWACAGLDTPNRKSLSSGAPDLQGEYLVSALRSEGLPGSAANSRKVEALTAIDAAFLPAAAQTPTGEQSLGVYSQSRPPSSAMEGKHKMDWESWIVKQVEVEATDGEKRWKDPPDTRLARFVNGSFFIYVVALAILVNTVMIGLEVDSSMRRVLADPQKEKADIFVISNFFFSTFFLVEILVRLFALQSAFFLGDDWQWNFFDAALVMVSVVDFFYPVTDVKNGSENRAYMRLLRIFRVGRVLRIVRILRFFRELRRMCMSIVSIAVSFAWALLLLTLICYIFSVLFMQAGVEYVRDNGDVDGNWDTWYGSLPETMYTLLKAVTGGEDWGPLVEPLQDASTAYVFCFVFFQLFVMFGVFNVLIGIFLTNAAEMFEGDRDWLMQAEIIKVESFKKNLRNLFVEVELHPEDLYTWEDIMKVLEEPRAKAFFSSFGLDIFDTHLVFSQMANEDGQVRLKEFVEGVGRMKDHAKQAHIIGLVESTDSLHQELVQVGAALRVLIQNLPPEPGLDGAEDLYFTQL